MRKSEGLSLRDNSLQLYELWGLIETPLSHWILPPLKWGSWMRTTLGSRQVLKLWVQNFVIFFWNVPEPWKHHSGNTWLSFQQMIFMSFPHNPECQYLPGDFLLLRNTNRENGSYLENLSSRKLFNWTFPQALSSTSQPIATGVRDVKVPPFPATQDCCGPGGVAGCWYIRDNM